MQIEGIRWLSVQGRWLLVAVVVGLTGGVLHHCLDRLFLAFWQALSLPVYDYR